MISHYSLRLSPPDGIRLSYGDAYRLYAALLEQLPHDYAEQLHESEITPIAQYLQYDRDSREYRWNVSLFGNEACERFGNVLKSLEYIELEQGSIGSSMISAGEYPDAASLIAKAEQLPESGIRNMTFLTPTTFKSGGEYVLFPSAELIIKSIISRMEQLCEDISVSDEDAVRMLIDGIRITGYELRSTGFFLKGQRIPSFIGSIRLHSRLSAPMQELWKLMLIFAELSGAGIKPALGMGAVRVNTE